MPFTVGIVSDIIYELPGAVENLIQGFLDSQTGGFGFVVRFLLGFADDYQSVGLTVENLYRHLGGTLVEERTFAHVAVAIVDNHGLGGILLFDFRNTDIATAHEVAGDEVGGVDAGAGGGTIGVATCAPGVTIDGVALGGGSHIEKAIALQGTTTGDGGRRNGEAAGEDEGSHQKE